MIYNFLYAINEPERGSIQHTRAEVMRATTVLEKFHKGDCTAIEM